MNCMKCGREIALGQAFCKECLEDMQQYPVRPDTPVQIPAPPSVNPNRRNTHIRKAKKPEEQLARLRRFVRFQTVILIFMVLFMIAAGIYLYPKLYPSEPPLRPGENYSTPNETATTPPAA